jgi:hypothetical protein
MMRHLSLRSTLAATITAMGALIILLAGLGLKSAIPRNRAAQRVVTLATVDGHIFDALAGMRIERGTTLGALANAAPGDSAAMRRAAW